MTTAPTKKNKEIYTDRFSDNISELAAKFNVAELYLFGSVLTSRFKKSSDIDFAVRFKTDTIGDYADNYFDFKDALASLLKREIDLIEIDALKNKYFIDELNTTKKLIYVR